MHNNYKGDNMVALLTTPASPYEVKQSRANRDLDGWSWSVPFKARYPAIYRPHTPSPKSYKKPIRLKFGWGLLESAPGVEVTGQHL